MAFVVKSCLSNKKIKHFLNVFQKQYCSKKCLNCTWNTFKMYSNYRVRNTTRDELLFCNAL